MMRRPVDVGRCDRIHCCHSGMRRPNSGLPEFGNIIVQVGNSRLGCAGPESILPAVVMDSGLALRAPRNDEYHLCKNIYRAMTSTSPSPPLTTVEERSNTLPSFLAMARYSPSDSTTRGNAPIDSLMTSPPGVITDHAVLAKASPPLSPTSFNVMTAARWLMITSVSLPA